VVVCTSSLVLFQECSPKPCGYHGRPVAASDEKGVVLMTYRRAAACLRRVKRAAVHLSRNEEVVGVAETPRRPPPAGVRSRSAGTGDGAWRARLLRRGGTF